MLRRRIGDFSIEKVLAILLGIVALAAVVYVLLSMTDNSVAAYKSLLVVE